MPLELQEIFLEFVISGNWYPDLHLRGRRAPSVVGDIRLGPDSNSWFKNEMAADGSPQFIAMCFY